MAIIDITDLEKFQLEDINIEDMENIPLIKGPKGDRGEIGEPGPANVLQIGKVEKGQEAKVTIEGASPNQIINFVLPQGERGETGEQGPPGQSYDDSEIRNMISDITEYKYRHNITQDTDLGAEITLPFNYKVGADVLDVYYVGQRLIKCSTYDDLNTGHYSEVGEADSISNKIKITSDWKASKGNYFDFVVRGEYNEA